MNYRNLSMDELVQVLSNEEGQRRFINAAKAFVQKFVDGDYVSSDNLDKQLDEARLKGYDCGHKEGYEEAKAEG